MREILFRGKNEYNGEWVLGSLHIEYGETDIDGNRDIDYRILGMRGECDYVIPETVGQFTGLTDKNGKKIFEGDILSVMVNEREESSEFIELGISNKITKIPTGNKIQAFWSVEWKTFRGSVGWRVYGKDRRFNIPLTPSLVFNNSCEVIGNIHDNPELLKGENNG